MMASQESGTTKLRLETTWDLEPFCRLAGRLTVSSNASLSKLCSDIHIQLVESAAAPESYMLSKLNLPIVFIITVLIALRNKLGLWIHNLTMIIKTQVLGLVAGTDHLSIRRCPGVVVRFPFRTIPRVGPHLQSKLAEHNDMDDTELVCLVLFIVAEHGLPRFCWDVIAVFGPSFGWATVCCIDWCLCPASRGQLGCPHVLESSTHCTNCM